MIQICLVRIYLLRKTISPEKIRVMLHINRHVRIGKISKILTLTLWACVRYAVDFLISISLLYIDVRDTTICSITKWSPLISSLTIITDEFIWICLFGSLQSVILESLTKNLKFRKFVIFKFQLSRIFKAYFASPGFATIPYMTWFDISESISGFSKQ